MLLGLASLEQALFKSEVEKKACPKGPVILKKTPSLDIARYEREIRTLWMLNETSHAHNALGDVLTTIQELEELEEQTRGNLQCHVRELLYSHYRLVSRVHRDLRNLLTACHYANQAVRVTKLLGRNDLIATSLFVRGFVRLVWGLHGEKAAFGIIKPSREKLAESLNDFEQALPLARPQFDSDPLISIPAENKEGLQLLRRYNFSERSVTRYMRRGAPVQTQRAMIYAQASPALG